MFFFKKIVWFTLLIFLFSCSGGKTNKQNKNIKKFKDFKTSVVFDSVKISSDTSMSYSLFLPSQYSPEKENRTVVFFDPHAKGYLPVKKYKNLAEKYSLVFAGSNNSKNGMNANTRNDIITKFLFDLEDKVNVDKQHLVTAGFSGGARIASLIGIYNSNVTGIIGCGGGFPGINKLNNTSFTWVGIVGNKDFNYLEMKNLYSQLKANNFKAYLLVFDGKHEWPPEDVMGEAFGILFSNKTKNLKYSIKKEETQVTPLDKKEVELQKMIVESFNSKGVLWWKKEISLLKDKSENAETGNERLMNARLLSYLGLVSYMFTDKAIKLKDFNSAKKYLTIYELVEPENPDMFYFKAAYFSLKNNNDSTSYYLKKAIDNGFDDQVKISVLNSK